MRYRLVLGGAADRDDAQVEVAHGAERNPAARHPDSGAEWTVVRCSWFNENFNESVFAEPIAAGELALPAGDVGEPFVDADDIADVAVAALTDHRHAGEVYELTGPRLLRFDEAVATIGRITGREVRYVTVPIDAWATA